MAEFLVAAGDLPTNYSQGDPIVVKPNGWSWGSAEGLPDFWRIVVSDLDHTLVEQYMTPLWEDAQPGDPEYDAPDASDRRIYRHRREIRIMWDEVPAAWLTQLQTNGVLVVTISDIRPYVRRVTFNRGNGQVEKTAEQVIP